MNKYIFLLLLCIGCAERPAVKYRAKLVTPHGKVYRTVEFSSKKEICIMHGQFGGQWLGNQFSNTSYLSAPDGWLIEYEIVE